MQTVIEDILVNYDIVGENNGENLVVLHGWGQDISTWYPTAIRLGENYRVFLIDLPGFGSSSTPQAPYNTDKYVSFLEKFTNKFKIKDPVIIGHSFGGKIAIKYASRKKVKFLVLVSPSGVESWDFLIFFKTLLSKFLKPLLFLVSAPYKEKILKLFGSSDYLQSGEMRETFKLVVLDSVFKEAGKINSPTLILWGENDKELPLATSKKLKNLIKNSTLRVLWGMGHSPQIENSQKLVKTLLEYL